MKLVSLDIPDDQDLLASWMEQQLVGLHLAELVAELETLAPGDDAEQSLDAIIGDRWPAVLSDGLAVLEPGQIQALLSRPRALLELQDRICREGGEYWLTVPVTPEHEQQTAAVWSRVQSQLNASAPSPVFAIRGEATAQRPWNRIMAVTLAVAAMLLIAVFLSRPGPAPTGWGWNRPGALAENGTAPEYLNRLADGADEWFKKRPANAAELELRLRQFRAGCDTLISAPHRPLAQVDRQWLVERCRAWRDKLDGHLAALEQGSELAAVQAAADETVSNLIKALRERTPAA